MEEVDTAMGKGERNNVITETKTAQKNSVPRAERGETRHELSVIGDSHG